MRTQSSQHTEEALKGIMMPLDSMEEMVICSGRGGGNGANDGGSDWGDGEGNLAGHGPGEDISSYVLTGWTLSPCTGGTYYMNGAEYIEGAGGGGGVLINGEGPAADKHTGEGYGGGASGISPGGVASNREAVQGAILLEVEPAQ